MPLSQNLPSFIKDCTDSINKIQALNAKGPLPVAFPLVSWDVVSMFPNTDNNLGITAVTKALDTRPSKFSCSDCIAEAVEICLRVNNSHFPKQNFVQKHGRVMDQKMHVVTRESFLKIRNGFFLLPTFRTYSMSQQDFRPVTQYIIQILKTLRHFRRYS